MPLPRSIRCDVCDATFTRQEHLTRHLRSHTTEKPFECPECGKGFSRPDVLHRHTQLHGAGDMSPRPAGSRACKECAIGRVRCPRGNPCQRCEQRGLQCVYPVARKRMMLSELPDSREVFPRSASDIHPPHSAFPVQVLEPEPQTDTHSATSQISQPLVPTGNGDNGNGWFAFTPQLSVPPPLDASHIMEKELNEWARNIQSVNWLSPDFGDMSIPGNDWLPLPNMNAEVVGAELGIQRPTYQPLPDAPNPNHLATITHPVPQASQPESSTPMASDSGATTVDSLASRPAEGTYYVEGSVGRTPFRGGGAASTRYHAQPSQSPVVISPEAMIPEGMYDHTVRSLLTECSGQATGLEFTNLPPRNEMQELVQFYFNGFHKSYPFLRKAPFVVTDDCSWILLLAVTAAGSRYAPTSQYHATGSFLASVVDHILDRRLRGAQRDDDDQLWTPVAPIQGHSGLDLVTLQAAVLNCFFHLHCGRREGTRRALVQRYSLVEAFHDLKLLSTVNPQSLRQTEGMSSDYIVQCWLDRESRIRTGWMIWLLDSIVPYEFASSPLLRIGDAKDPLPSTETIWDYPTAESVANQNNHSVTLIDALEMLYMEKSLPPSLGDLSTAAVIFAICRRTKEATVECQTGLTLWSPDANKQSRSQSQQMEETWPPVLPSISKWRNSSCDSLDILHWAANSIAAQAGAWEHPTIFHLHLSRLLLLAPLQHIQQFSTAAPTRSATQQQEYSDASTSQYHVIRWAIRDQYKARLSVIHAGALLWHVRRYSTKSFLEPFGVYAATLVIWAYSVSVQFVRRQTSSTSTSQPSGPGQQHPTGPEALDGDTSAEDAETTVIQLDRPCDDEIVQGYITSDHKMSARMSGVGDICEPSAPKRVLKQGIRLLNGVVHKPLARRLSQSSSNNGAVERPAPSWGIEHSFADTLRFLLTVSILPEEQGVPPR